MKATIYAAAAALATSAQAAQFVMYVPGGDSDLVERADAIVSPGEISAHTHQIFGASNAAPDMTYESLQKSDCSTVGNAAGDGNAQDKSVYWHPSLFAEAKDGSGYVRIPSGGHKMYYRDVGNAADKKADPFEFPKNFHMVAGDQTRRVANEDKQHQLITEWLCHTSGGINEGVDQKSGFPENLENCDQYPGLGGSIHFPHCWNGKEPKVNDNSHMSYPEGDVQAGPCPSSHPIRVPHIFMENFFDLKSVADKIEPNTFVLSQGDPTGYGYHADFFNGWDEGAIPALYDSCPQPYYGNSDIGTCPTFKGFSIKKADCKLKVHYKEDNDKPGEYLPGCNPITTKNPAPKMKAAELGVCSNECVPASAPNTGNAYDSHNETESDDKKAPSYKAPSVSLPTYGKATSAAKDKAPATTLATAYSAPSPAAYANAAADVVKDAAGNILYVTQVVTVTAPGYNKREAAPTPAAELKRNEHLHRHRRHMHKN
ncbi:hypothetical protein Slin15195_G060140 [Septoria linicola]|uniref:DUF1996 domain-containing protein n=1 Tax=Septoria linicola TaxID=215465 RepID=A0A9Q9EJ65_9PEZI|nr:hypothetical protein Slin15195_G060140 [Septoria linicola]